MKKTLEQLPFSPAKWPFFYGWVILFWGVVGVLLSVPGQTTGVSAFIEPLISELGISRMQITDAYLLGTLTSSFLLTPFGKLYDRIGARWMGFGSCTALGLVLFLLSRTDRIVAGLPAFLPQQKAIVGVLAVLFFMLRLSGQGVLTMAARNMVMKWFDRHRGLASGISGAAVSFGFSYTPAFFSGLIAERGWSGTWFLLSILLIGLFAPLLLIFFRDNPEASGLIPDGKALPQKHGDKPEAKRQYTLPEARRTFCFWAFTMTMALQALVLTAVTFNIESIFELAGMDGASGFNIFKPIAIISVIINLFGGWLSDRIELRWLLAVMALSMAVNLIGLSRLTPGWPITCMIIGGGVANGLFGILMSITWPRYYGREHLGAISGLCMTMLVIFSALGPSFYSRVLFFTDHYTAAHLLCLAASTALFAGSFFARNPQHSRR